MRNVPVPLVMMFADVDWALFLSTAEVGAARNKCGLALGPMDSTEVFVSKRHERATDNGGLRSSDERTWGWSLKLPINARELQLSKDHTFSGP